MLNFKRTLSIIVVFLGILTLVACGQRDNLTSADFPTIGSGLTKSELEQAVGKPHESSRNDLEVLEVMTVLLSASIEVDQNWNAIEETPTEYYVYKLSDGESAMVAILVGEQVVEMTTHPIPYTE